MNVCNLFCRTNRDNLFHYLATENHIYRYTLEIPEGAHGLKMPMFFFRVQDSKLDSSIQVGVYGMLRTCWALLSSSLESKLSGVISPSSVYKKLQFIQELKCSCLQLIRFFYSFPLFVLPHAHTKSCSEGNSWVCICKCKFDSYSCVCVCVVPATDS